jgi:hypothetical protein
MTVNQPIEGIEVHYPNKRNKNHEHEHISLWACENFPDILEEDNTLGEEDPAHGIAEDDGDSLRQYTLGAAMGLTESCRRYTSRSRSTPTSKSRRRM